MNTKADLRPARVVHVFTPMSIFHLLARKVLPSVTFRWSSVPTKTDGYRMNGAACALLTTATWRCSSTFTRTASHGMHGHALKLASRGHLEILKYAHENGCPWDQWSCRGAAKNGQMEVLKYLHKSGCPCDERTCEAAAAA